jgi:exopolysaccharide biosynthesis polyprenyl glycosylphosphotransferase
LTVESVALTQGAAGRSSRLPATERRGISFEVEGKEVTQAHRRNGVFRRTLLVADIGAVALSLLVAAGGAPLRPMAALLPVLFVVAAKTMGLYDRDELVLQKRTITEAPKLFQLATLFALCTWMAQSLVTSADLAQPQVAVLWFMLAINLTLSRTAGRIAARAFAGEELCLVVGDETAHRRLAEKVGLDTRLRAQVVAHLPLVERRASSDEPPHNALERCVCSQGIQRVIVAADGADPGVVQETVARAKTLGVNVSVLPRICEVVGSSVEFDDLGGMTLLGVRPLRLPRSSQVIKRVVDAVGAAVALLLTAPFFAVCAVAIRLDSRGPVLFRQTRVGRDGEHFMVLKFRTMVDGAHELRNELTERSNGAGLFKIPDDPRVTRVGRILRRTSLDELPQLVNVLRGQMSLVGPRPLSVEEDRLVAGWHRRRLHLKPGLTGPWQVLGSPTARVGLADMATIDYLYVANWSLWADVQVILRTIAYVLRTKGV